MFRVRAKLIIGIVIGLISAGLISPSAYATHDATKIDVLSSENISTADVNNVKEVYLNTFRPNTQIFFKISMNNAEATTLVSNGSKLDLAPNSTFQFSVTSGATLDQATLKEPIRLFTDAAGKDVIKVFPTPPDFPITTFSGDTSLVAKRQILSTPVVTTGTYALATKGTQVNYFIRSPNNIIGFRNIDDSSVKPSLGGVPFYAYLEQTDFGVTATSPGYWRILDKNFNPIERINKVQTKFGLLPSEGHGMTTSPNGNAVVITTPTREVDSSWLKRQYKLPILDCDVAEIRDGKAINEFSFWDWAVAHKAIAQPMFDAMPLFNDPQNPTSSPIDICHANSMEYYKPANVYLLSFRSPSIVVVLDSKLKSIKSILHTNGSLQHFARFVNKNQITSFGNYTFGKASKFQVFNRKGNDWKLTEYEFPVHAEYCANANFLDKSHVWLGGGCGPFTPGVLGAIYKIDGLKLVEVGQVKLDKFTYSYRADLL